MMTMALVCLQAQQVSGLPAAAEGRQIQLHLLLQQQEEKEDEEAAASARCRAGVASFHDQVLLLHCAPPAAVTSVAVRVSGYSCLHPHHRHDDDLCQIDLAAQLHHPSPSVLSFVLHAGAVLSLTLHHRLIRRRRRSACPMMIPDLLLNCLRTDPKQEEEEDGDQSSSGFITIEKGTISKRRPPSDNLLTTDDSEGDDKTMALPLTEEEELQVENEFLAKLHLLDALIKDAEARPVCLED